MIVIAPDALEDADRDSASEARPGEQTDEAPSVHSAPTREFAAYAEELAAQSMLSRSTRELAVHEAPTREFSAHLDESPVRQNSGPRTRVASGRREDEITLRVVVQSTVVQSTAPRSRDATADELMRMLGPSPTPDLGNIEIYYRLGLAFVATGKLVQARRCFLTVEDISPGYRDAAVHLAEIPMYAPTVSGATPVHHLPERVQRRK